MNGFFRGWLYRLWVFGGLAAVVGIVLYVGLTTKPGAPPPYPTIGAAVGVYLIGILVLQAIGIARGKPRDDATHVPTGPSDQPPKTDEELMAVLALPDEDGTRASRRRQAASESYGFTWAQWLPLAATAVLLPLAGFLWVTGAVPQVWQPLGPTGPGIPVAAIPGLVIVVILFLLLPRTLRRARQISDDYNAPLGLAIDKTPQVILLPRVGTGGVGAHIVGPTTFAGRRYGRDVLIDTYAGSSAVLVGCETAEFTLAGDRGPLTVETGVAPAAVAAFLANLDDSRFNGIRIAADPSGIRIDRRGASHKQGWLLDLWLAERLADLQQVTD